MVIWYAVVLLALAETPVARISPALIGTWIALAFAGAGAYYNGLRNRRETIKAMDARTMDLVRKVLADPELKKSFDERTGWLINDEFSQRGRSFVSKDRYDERNDAVNDRFIALDKQLADINTKIDAIPTKVREEVIFILDHRGVTKREDR